MLVAILLITAGVWALYGFWLACLVLGCLMVAIHIMQAIFRRIPIQRK